MRLSPLRIIRPAAAPALVVALLLAGCGSDKKVDSSSTTTTTAAAGSTTTIGSTPATTTTGGPTTTTEATSEPGTQPEQAIWPFADQPTRYDDPEEAARSFAKDYLGFPAPDPGGFQQGDTTSGEVPMQPKAGSGPVTTILVRLVDGTWWVSGASTPNIDIQQPETLMDVSSPVKLEGSSTAFEATVNYEVRQTGSTKALGKGSVMGGSNGEMGPFSKEVTFEKPTEKLGAIVMLTYSAEDGSVQEASVVRVYLV